MQRLECSVQHYAWGKKGLQSSVCDLVKENYETIHRKKIDTDKPYAELWMGTHPNAPSKVQPSSELLSSFLKSQVSNYFSSEEISEFFQIRGYEFASLPYLFKVLSVNQALSIQAHPDEQLAQKLFKSDPEHYKDPYHKPELCCALTDFEALCAFQKLETIISNIRQVKELQALLKSQNHELVEHVISLKEQDIAKLSAEERKTLLQKLFHALMTSSKSQVETHLPHLINRLNQSETKSGLENLILRLYSDYGNDIGCFSVFFLNYVTLKPGEGLFLGPNEPHAYLSGDCMECMASSDNVVRAGLTPKFIDTETLVEMLTYDDCALDKMKCNGEKVNDFETLYAPPVSEFKVQKIVLPNQFDKYQWSTNAISIAIVLEGKGLINGEKFVKGDVVLLPFNATPEIENAGNDQMVVFVASTNITNISVK
ncbi:hypothetical protein FDP41_011911 [Naegleria fowleri]|uniref:mannose-6-phosphate isomerase n=1 Tax=Naegleria fowleri TaxID=5763 RepID=A0A6A5C8F9_NAEFO|nr:uncharacterized protein FDP41_011911 [Naegleria fowleri]KAF0982050.1 hypothetical protein FDP41_011911 [Naegleria fowleri]CAG4711872.1 unnamed protein product [Naegleria fowleri]